MLEVAARHELHRYVESAEGFPRGENAHHVRVAEGGRQARLLLECGDALAVAGKLLT
jgi:hypothetical protein